MRYHPEIDGLRALAVTSVLVYHADVAGISGGFTGVDVFFVISGYLISGILFSELSRTGSIDFVNFWARRTRRLLPSAILVIVASILVARHVLSDLSMAYSGRDAIYAALYLINWQKLISAIDYFNDESGAGLFIHYWSLAVEEQFYIFLSLVFLFVMTASRRFNATHRQEKIAIWAIALLGLISFLINVVVANTTQPVAFFGTHARIWQLAAGAIVYFLVNFDLTMSARARHVAAWSGLALMVGAMVLLDSELNYPGIYAVAPTLGAALFILAGGKEDSTTDQGRRPLPVKFFSFAAPVLVGKISYALYLWHWPVFYLYQAYFETWGAVDKVIAILITGCLSYLSFHLVENPVRRSLWLGARPMTSLTSAVAITIITCGALFMLQSHYTQGRIILASGAIYDPAKVRLDKGLIYEVGCHTAQKATTYEDCIFGDTDSSRKMFLVGDSHAAHWFPTMADYAATHGYALYSRTKSACIGIDVPTWNSLMKREYHECAEWRGAVHAEIERENADVVVLANSSSARVYMPETGEKASAEDSAALLAAAETRFVEQMLAHGTKVVLMSDMPWFPSDPLDCLIENPRANENCNSPQDESWLPLRSPWSPDVVDWDDQLLLVDFKDNVCSELECAVANDEMVMFRDRHHMTATYAATLSSELASVLNGFLETPASDSK
ncbi:acyltransferase family protein [Tropicimonas sp. TH_r6]|uniref:acyltransferase family protein n=1 Tax=Tropicimonas sp. TH_r6 TaxID=3082085 RepID=UPI0029542E93|nr:acyltransferase family protein [Tropicimonas sp. TH_r6]MDV7143187.1 acyltransferase family protein [Tropicimonas sp. TH_r6]